MANTIAKYTLINNANRRVILVVISSDGTSETATNIFDSSTFAGTDSQSNKIRQAWISCSHGSASARTRLLWGANTNVLALSIPNNNQGYLDFRKLGGIANYAGTGKTGDILITTTAANNGDRISILLDIENS